MLNTEFFRKELMDAMRNKEVVKKECLQMIIANIRNKEIELKSNLNEDEIVKIIRKEIKSLNETISLAGNRDTSIYEEKINYLKQFLPAQLSDEEVMDIINKNCSGMTNMGQIMKTIIPILHGRTDNKTVAMMVNKFLDNK